MTSGATAWGDYDNDGDLDVALMGDTGSGYVTRIYRNDGGGVFTDSGSVLPAVSDSSAAWADYNNDGRLDLLLTGDSDSVRISRIYRNDGSGGFSDIADQMLRNEIDPEVKEKLDFIQKAFGL